MKIHASSFILPLFVSHYIIIRLKNGIMRMKYNARYIIVRRRCRRTIGAFTGTPSRSLLAQWCATLEMFCTA